MRAMLRAHLLTLPIVMALGAWAWIKIMHGRHPPWRALTLLGRRRLLYWLHHHVLGRMVRAPRTIYITSAPELESFMTDPLAREANGVVIDLDLVRADLEKRCRKEIT